MSTEQKLEAALLIAALRQYRHNDGEGFVFAYDKSSAERLVAGLIETLEMQRNSLINALTPEILDWIRCGLAVNGRLKDGDHPALAKLRAAINASKAVMHD